MDELMKLKAECWDLARQIDAINAQMQPYVQQVQSIQQQIAEKNAQIIAMEEADGKEADTPQEMTG